jgi:hypothetical protein
MYWWLSPTRRTEGVGISLDQIECGVLTDFFPKHVTSSISNGLYVRLDISAEKVTDGKANAPVSGVQAADRSASFKDHRPAL